MLLIWKGFICFERETAERQRNGAPEATWATGYGRADALPGRWNAIGDGFPDRTTVSCYSEGEVREMIGYKRELQLKIPGLPRIFCC